MDGEFGKKFWYYPRATIYCGAGILPAIYLMQAGNLRYKELTFSRSDMNDMNP